MTQNSPEHDYAGKIRQIVTAISAHKGPIYIAAHVDPDGDAIGSVLGLSRGLKKLGFDARPVATSPRYLSFLPLENELLAHQTRLPEDALLLALDCGDAARVEGVPMDQAGIVIINVDHHGSNPRYGQIALVEPGKAATAMIVKDVLEAMNLVWDESVATPVLTGIITDTGSFKFSNTDAGVLRDAASLVERGAKLAEINEQIATQPRNFFRLQAEVYATIAYPLGGQMVTAYVNNAMLEKIGASWEEVESLVSFIRNAEGVQLAALLKDYGDRTKVSLRSRGLVSAQNIALALGGGGHVAAAGASLTLPFDQALETLLEASRAEFERVGLSERVL
jgi:bifunctional oligoribonuclease and PAP phosphatase NrnA